MAQAHMLSAVMLFLLASWAQGQGDIERPFLSPRNCPNFSYDAFYDFVNNSTTTNPNVITVESFSGTGCATRGVLKLALASAAVDPNRRRVLVDFFLDGNPTQWVFNLGDSQSNNGWAGDAGDQSRDAEVQGYGSIFAGYLSDNGGSGQAFNARDLYSTRFTLVAGDGHVVWFPNNNNLFNYYYNPDFYALNGQSDATGPANYDLFLGINRVISTYDRFGSGICKVGIKFLPEF